LEPVEHFGLLVKAEALRRGSANAEELVVIGDGAPWIWNLAGDHFENATHIVDLYHARQHLYDLAAQLAGVLGDERAGWLEKRLEELDDGDVEAVLEASRALELSDTVAIEVEKALGYFETNIERMRCAAFRRLGYFVGSGAVETTLPYCPSKRQFV
jgi:hypothetical protein